jgi:biopolymer transport protein ExbD
MAQIENTANGQQARSFSHNKKQMIRIDMTPMVDLGFLLITFFVFTMTMSTLKVTELFMPSDKPVTILPELPKSLALTLILDGDDNIYYYHGDFNDAAKTNEIYKTGYSTNSGIGKVIRQKQKDIDASRKFAEGRRGLMLLIKPTSTSNYKNVIDALDEAVINDVKKYAILEPAQNEIEFIKNKNRSGF